ncbi:MAG: alpha/beta hydrolase [Saprospiraceae bacterium]|nr:alpha/beta hydrolase [Candidatus Vicinibacter affinis]MBP6171972.1 alpha/beta hydrolase [Saprospiraceae bacterium]MBK6573140.1 alpha/beta hydrolase [Candidatus Vicinibacter affinis]MBK7301821.1 alpha/beta hydrolase [Candidatus Vicinibacter affinis]MBK7692959.1 alpha/beta hydrolase [Candidatus Vicinibacter affinis]
MTLEIIHEGRFKYIESKSEGEVILLLHGLFGALSNFKGIIDYFGSKYRVIVPILPIYELPILQVSLTGLVNYVYDFVRHKDLDKIHLLGNSLGGHVGLLYALEDLDRVSSITLTGSSGLYESGMGNTFPKRGDYDFIKTKTEATFYDPNVATKELVDEVYGIVNDRGKAIRVIATAKSAIRHNLGDKLHLIERPALLIWGANDIVTPPFVGEKFKELLPSSKLFILEKCGHAPMMEKPEEFNLIFEKFLKEIS